MQKFFYFTGMVLLLGIVASTSWVIPDKLTGIYIALIAGGAYLVGMSMAFDFKK